MKKIFKRAFYVNIMFLFYWIALALLNFKENRGNFINLFYITILGEIAYWIVIVVGANLIKKFKS